MTANWYPVAVDKRIPAGPNDPKITPVMAVLHVSASRGPSLFNWFNGPSGGIESHFYITRKGVVEQYRSVDHEADAQNAGNSWLVPADAPAAVQRLGAVSIETEGLGGGSWNDKQIAAIKALLLWLHKEHGVPLKPVKSAQPNGLHNGGVSYHARFASWNVNHHACPGAKRVMQFVQVLRPWMNDVTNCLHCPIHCPKES